MIREEELREIRELLEKSHRPVFIFDSDTDGLASFLLFYKRIGEGKAVIKSGGPSIEKNYVRKVRDYQPDQVFILDVPIVTPEFWDNISTPIMWLDHHPPIPDVPKKIKYYNPRKEDPEDGRPTSYWAYQAVKENLWIAMTGIIGDYYLLLKEEFSKKYPDLLPPTVNSIKEALYETRIGKLIRILNFNLKGKYKDILTSVKILTRINDPYEILEQKTPAGKRIYKKYERVNNYYEELKNKIIIGEERIIVFTYENEKYSITGDLATELITYHPDKIFVIGRIDKGIVRMSLRSNKDVNIARVLERVFKRVKGYGGGHSQACGASVPVEEFERFVKVLKEEIRREE